MNAAAEPGATPVRYPLVVVDRSKDPDVYDSGWMRLLYPKETPDLRLSETVRAWDTIGRPVTVAGGAVELASLQPDPEAREVLLEWRRRVPVPLLAGGSAGDTAIQFIVSDVATARSKLTQEGGTRVPGTFRRVLPIVLMLVAAVTLVPLMRMETWGIGIVVVLYTVTTALMHRWSYPPGWWGNPPTRAEHDRISWIAVLSKVVFWSVAAAAATLVMLDMMGVVDDFVAWV